MSLARIAKRTLAESKKLEKQAKITAKLLSKRIKIKQDRSKNLPPHDELAEVIETTQIKE